MERKKNKLQNKKFDNKTDLFYETKTKRLFDIQKAFNELVKFSIKNDTLEELLEKAMEIISTQCLITSGIKGCIFILNENENILEMVAQKNMSEYQIKRCKTIQPGECICGATVLNAKAEYVDHVDERHSIKWNEMDNHGHYCMPIMNDEKVAGVINIYIPENHKRSSIEENFLDVIAGYLSHIISYKKSEDSLLKFFRAVEQTADHIIITDKNGKIEYANKTFEDLTGYTKEDWYGQTPRILKSGKHDLQVYEKLWNVILSGKPHKGITINKKKDNSLYYEEKTITPIKDKFGNITHFVSTGKDITEMMIYQEELKAAKNKAEESNRLKSDFLAQMSHEIRTPINSILSFSSLIKFSLQDKIPDELQSAFRYIESGGKRLIRTIDLILNMSQVQNGNFNLKLINIDLLDDIIRPLFSEFSHCAKEKNLDFNVIVNSNNTDITGDSYTITQIFENLIDNAIKFTTEGKVEITIYRNMQNNLCVDVMDTGVGISEEYMNNLFEPFTQEETGYTRRFEGNGLGLALVKKYVDINNAEINVQSKKGSGSTITIIFNKTHTE